MTETHKSDSHRASRQLGGNNNFQPQTAWAHLRQRGNFPFPAPNIKTSYINHHTEGWSKEGMLRVATSLENSMTVFSLSVLCLVPLPRREWEEEEAPESSEQLRHSRFQPLIAESVFRAHGGVGNLKPPSLRGICSPLSQQMFSGGCEWSRRCSEQTTVSQAPAFQGA